MMKCVQINILAIFLLLLPVAAGADNAVALHEIQVRLDPEHHSLTGEARITMPPGQARSIRTGGVTVTSVSVLGAAFTTDAKTGTITINADSGPRHTRVPMTR